MTCFRLARRVALLALAAAALLPAPGRSQGVPSVGSCALGARLAFSREEGRCARARHEILPAQTDWWGWWRVGAVRVRALPVAWLASSRSGYPSDANNGAHWAGRGLSTSLSAGMEVQWSYLRFAFAPHVGWSGNRSFELPDSTPPGWSSFADPWGVPGLDRYLRPGPNAVAFLDAGDSYLEVDGGYVRGGLSTERFWWGPARRYPLLFSGTGPGFPHAFAETSEPLALGSGDVTLRLVGGHLRESGWFDADAGNDRRLVAAAQAAWRVGFVPGLEVALSVVRHEPLSGGELGVRPWFQLFTGDPSGEDPERRGSTLATASFRISFPEEGVEAYGEVGRGDLFVNALEGVSETRHAMVYTLGMTRSDTTRSGTPWRFWGEVTKQALELPQPGGSPQTAYRSGSSLPHGHTHRGQLLGTWIGPGSNAQTVGLDFPGGPVPWGVFAERIRRDDDTYYRVWQANYGFLGHDLEWTLGARGARIFAVAPLGSLRVSLDGGISRRKNRSFIGLDGVNWTFRREWNRWADLRVMWVPPA